MAKKEENPVATTVEATEEKKVVKRELSPEEIVKVNAAIASIKQNASEKFSAVLDAVVNWNTENDEVRLQNRKDLVAKFGTSDDLKAYIKSDEFANEANPVLGMSKLAVVLNIIVSYYSRESQPRKKVAKQTIQIAGEYYSVNAEYLKSIMDLPKDERRKLILEHADTVKQTTIEEF